MKENFVAVVVAVIVGIMIAIMAICMTPLTCEAATSSQLILGRFSEREPAYKVEPNMALQVLNGLGVHHDKIIIVSDKKEAIVKGVMTIVSAGVWIADLDCVSDESDIKTLSRANVLAQGFEAEICFGLVLDVRNPNTDSALKKGARNLVPIAINSLLGSWGGSWGTWNNWSNAFGVNPNAYLTNMIIR